MKTIFKIWKRFLVNFLVLRKQVVSVRVSFFTALKVAFLESTDAVGCLVYKKANILMDLRSHRQIRRLGGGIKEPETVKWTEENIKEGDVFYDVGANVGAFSFLALRACGGGRCKVYSFEPSFSTFAALCRNIFLNEASAQIHPFQIALSDTTSLSRLNYSNLAEGSALHKWGVNSTDKPSQMVPSWRLDDFIKTFKILPPNLIKVDVDGYEFSVLSGARETLRNPQLRSILIEIDETLPANKDIYKIIEEAGFSLVAKYRRGAPTTFSCIFVRKEA